MFIKKTLKLDGIVKLQIN